MKAWILATGTVLLLIATGFFGYKWVERSDFDRMCAVFTRAVTDTEYLRMDPAQRAARVAQEIHGVLYAPAAIRTFSAIAVASPKSRVALIKMSAEEVRGGPWDCPALEAFWGQEDKR